ncbi:MAG: hypothetical protein J6C34_01920 [Oscillospiraceae bacterium]|nr:hypothetical protein [Oscillospiraceae bacterium]MBP1574356.1 hypothetical protein [Oscillospiraceae bacterium]MBQ8594740.1 hypothetical protein [Oscillospiraceae bacterium]
MSEFDDFIRGIGSDIKNAAEQVGKKAEETFEISKRRAEKMKIKGHIQSLYQKLGELTYGGMKNGEDVSEETDALIAQLDEAFARVEELFEEINAIRNGTFVQEEEMDWEEEYAEEYDVNVEEIIEEAKAFEEPAEEIVPEEKVPEEEPAKVQEFDINID